MWVMIQKPQFRNRDMHSLDQRDEGGMDCSRTFLEEGATVVQHFYQWRPGWLVPLSILGSLSGL